jgi:hypothetical protein
MEPETGVIDQAITFANTKHS